MPKQKNSKKGFTIIEVVLVLAIAGLIFLMVFVALPALQRSQRDTQRRQDYADLLASVNSYITNSNGNLPKANTTLSAKEYVNSTGNGPSGTAYTVNVCNFGEGKCKSAPTGASSNSEGAIQVIRQATCNSGTPKKVASTKAFVIYGDLESGTYCQSSN